MDSYDPSEAGHFGVRLFYMFRDFARRAGLRVGSRMGGPTVASTMHSRACAKGAAVQGRVSSVWEVIFDGWPDRCEHYALASLRHRRCGSGPGFIRLGSHFRWVARLQQKSGFIRPGSHFRWVARLHQKSGFIRPGSHFRWVARTSPEVGFHPSGKSFSMGGPTSPEVGFHRLQITRP